MRDVFRFCRYAIFYLLAAPSLRLFAMVRRPLFLVATTAFSLAVSSATGSTWAGEIGQMLSAASPAGGVTGAAAMLWLVAVGCVFGVLASFLGLIAVVGLLRGAVKGSHLVAKAWRVTPLRVWAPDPRVERVVGCQVTDLHLCAEETMPYELEEAPELWRDAEPPSGGEMYRRARAVVFAAAAEARGVMFVTGDATDRGEPAAWARFVSLMNEAPVDNCWIVPGNHDVTFNTHREPDYFLRAWAARRERFKAAARAATAREASYPHLYRHEAGEHRVAIITLSSVEYRSDNLLSNAVGRFGPAQLERLAELLTGLAGPVLVLCHHHLGPISRKRFRFDELLMNAVDAARLLEVLAAYARRRADNQVLVIHGHRHVRSYGQHGDDRVFVAGMPSSTLGEQDAAGVFDGELAFSRVGFDGGGGWTVSLERLAYIPGRRAAPSSRHVPSPNRHAAENVV